MIDNRLLQADVGLQERGPSGTYSCDMRVSRSYPGTDQIVRFW